MAKISKRVLSKHNQAVQLLKKDDLNFNDREFIFKNYHEGAGKMNNLISAHFTPPSIARSMAQNTRLNNFVDLCAGIGVLSYACVRQFEWDPQPYTGICVENCVEYYEVGKKLLPECTWINGSIFDQKVIDQIKEIMKGKEFSIICNPPYGKQVKGNNDKMQYTGAEFEYKAIEIGAILGAYDGAFLIPQLSAPFRITGSRGQTYDNTYKTSNYIKFIEQTGLEITANPGFCTDISEDEPDWKDVSIITEIGIVEYSELNYKAKAPKVIKLEQPEPEESIIYKQTSLF